MRIILLVLLFVIWESAVQSSLHWQRIDPAVGVPIFFSGYCLLILITRLWGARLARGLVRGDLGRAVDRFNLGLALARLIIPAWFALAVFVLGWKPLVDRMLGPVANWPLITPGAGIGLLPGLLAWMGLWWSQYPVDRALREQNFLYNLESDLPIFTPPIFREYFLNKLRVQLLFTIVPLSLILVLRDLAAVVIATLSHSQLGQRWGFRSPVSDAVDSLLSFGAGLAVILLSPELLRRVLHTQVLPESDLRQSLSKICTDSGIRCREILLWRTQNNMGNAAVMGLFPLVRYVMLSDLLLESMTDLQIQAVFAHELGHVKHRHLTWFVLCLITVSTCLLSLVSLIEGHLHLSATWDDVYAVASNLGCFVLLLIGYGFLSRWFERQADVYAARALEKPMSEDHREGFGAAVFASALERVAMVNNIPMSARNWTHGSIQSRVRYIHRLGRDPQVAERFDRTGRRVFIALIATVVICGAVAVYGTVLELVK